MRMGNSRDILPRLKIWDFDACLRRPQARRPQVETAGTAMRLFTKHDAREYRFRGSHVGADVSACQVRVGLCEDGER
jgi:hypothetical protein